MQLQAYMEKGTPAQPRDYETDVVSSSNSAALVNGQGLIQDSVFTGELNNEIVCFSGEKRSRKCKRPLKKVKLQHVEDRHDSPLAHFQQWVQSGYKKLSSGDGTDRVQGHPELVNSTMSLGSEGSSDVQESLNEESIGQAGDHSSDQAGEHSSDQAGERTQRTQPTSLASKAVKARAKRKPVRGKPYLCPMCEYSTKYAGDLRRHIRRHTGERPHKCPLCDYTSVQSGNLKQHLANHSGEKPYSCSLCDYKSQRASHIKQHMRKHTGERPYVCGECDYSCAHSSGLSQHIASKHTKYRPFQCELCDKRYTDMSSFNKHMRKHKGDKPYKCTKCDFRSTHTGDIKRHLYNMHMDESTKITPHI